MKYDKLVRDKIPRIIEKSGRSCRYYMATKDEYPRRLHAKLREEIKEFEEDPCEEELADIMEVLEALMTFYGVDPYEVETARQAKQFARGSFTDRVVLTEVLDEVP